MNDLPLRHVIRIWVSCVCLCLALSAQGADVTGTNGNDLLFMQGNVQSLNTMVVNAYTGESISVNGVYNVNAVSYDGLGGSSDTLFFTGLGDALFIEDPISGNQMVANVEVFFAGAGADVVNLSSLNYSLGNILIDGGAQDDILWANGGNDTIYGREGMTSPTVAPVTISFTGALTTLLSPAATTD